MVSKNAKISPVNLLLPINDLDYLIVHFEMVSPN